MYTLNTVERHAVCYGISAYESNAMKSANPNSGIYVADTSRTLDLNGGNPACNQGGMVVVDCAGFNSSVGERAQGGMEYIEQKSATLRSGDVRAVVYDCRGNGTGGVSPTLTGDHGNRVTDYTAVTVFDQQRFGQYGDGRTASSLKARDYKDATDLVVENRPPRRYIVRRLTPLECCRLQGYPDGWTENLAIVNPTDEQVDFFAEVWARWANINGVKPKSRAQVIKWLGDPQSDSAEYKAYGNSLAIPCSSDVLGRIARAMEVEGND